MALSLEVFGEKANGLGPAMSYVFGKTGGTIGRSDNNDWVLEDKFISSKHALVTYKRGEYYVRDTSTNGTFVNDPQMERRRRGTIRLKDGDVLYMGMFSIRVNVYPDLPESCPKFDSNQENHDYSDSIVISEEAQEALDGLLNTDFVDAEPIQAEASFLAETSDDGQNTIRDLLLKEGIPENSLNPDLLDAVNRILSRTVTGVLNRTVGNALDDALKNQLDS
ncbi:MAG: FHA domain-containing protein [Pseudomonadota bacterium]